MKNRQIFVASIAVLVIMLSMLASAEDKGQTIILGMGGMGGMGGLGGFGGGSPNVITGGKKEDVIIIGPYWGRR